MDGSARPPSLDELLDQERWLQALARRLVRDAATADDLVQETWFRTLSARRDPRAGATPVADARAWLGRVLRNVWRERGRSERARRGREARVTVSEGSPTARESLERFELHQRLAAFVLELDEPFRSVVIWRYYEGLSAAAIATLLGEPAARVRWHLMRARELLRQRLDRDRNDWTERYALFLPLAQRGAPAVTPAAAGAAGLGALSLGLKPLAWVGAGVLLVWTLVRLGTPGGPGRPSELGAPGGTTLLASEETAQDGELAPAELDPPERAPVPALGLPPAVVEETGTERASSGRVRGTVKSAEDGRTLPGAELALFEPGGRSLHASTSSDAAGAFLFRDVEPGEYELACRLEGRRPQRLPAFELAAGGESVLEVALELGFPVTVEVVERVSGAAVAGARVELIAGSRDRLVWLSADDLRFHTLSGITSPGGRVELGGAVRGTYQYSVQSREYATSLGEALIEPGAAPLLIRLEHGAVVHGVVRHASGLPAEGARVFLTPVVYTRVLDELVFRQNGLATGRDGSYRLEGVPEGLYYAVALLPDGSGSFHFDPTVRDERDLGRILVEDSAEVTLDFDLPAPGRVRGRVLDTAGRAIPGATVSVSWGDFKPGQAGFFPIASVPGVKESIHHSRRSDEEGNFEIDALRISHRKLELRVHCAGFVEEKLQLDAIEGNVLVIDPEGWPMEPVFEAHLSDQEDPQRGLLADGRTRFCLRPGTHHAILIRGLEARQALPFEVTDDCEAGDGIQEHTFQVEAGR